MGIRQLPIMVYYFCRPYIQLWGGFNYMKLKELIRGYFNMKAVVKLEPSFTFEYSFEKKFFKRDFILYIAKQNGGERILSVSISYSTQRSKVI